MEDFFGVAAGCFAAFREGRLDGADGVDDAVGVIALKPKRVAFGEAVEGIELG